MSRPSITLTTDFGQADGYVGTMKGVILSICPDASIVDISHDIRPQAIRQAAYVLSTAAPYFHPGTVHLVVVDPGVGSERRPIVVQTERATYVAPDNGVLSMAISQEPPRLAIHLTRREYHLPFVSATFHGRDVFAPAAAHLAAGADPRDMGTPIPVSDLVSLPFNRPALQPDGSWLGEVLHVDRFGNLVTSFHCRSTPSKAGEGTMLNEHSAIDVAGRRIGRVMRTYADVAPGDLVATIGSSGRVEIAVRDGNAATWLGVDVGEPVRVYPAALIAEARP